MSTLMIRNGTVVTATDHYTADVFVEGEKVRLSAIAGPGWVFTGWEGDVSGVENPLTISLNRNMTVFARFTEGQPVSFLPLISR